VTAEPDDATYLVTDIEATGFRPGRHSMLSFATIAVTATGEERGRFEAVLAELPGSAWHPGTRAWFEDDEPEALLAATTGPREPAQVMSDFVGFVLGLPAPRIFTAHPVAFDGSWIDFYLRRFTDHQLLDGLYEPEPLFHDTLCLRSYAAAVTGRGVTGQLALGVVRRGAAHPSGDRRRAGIRPSAGRALPSYSGDRRLGTGSDRIRPDQNSRSSALSMPRKAS
jgi:hypothetical protein